MGAARGRKAACHSDETSRDGAQALQRELDPVTLEPLAAAPPGRP
jgi:hypothetical protein